MAEVFALTEEMRAAVGVESEPWPYEVTATGIRAFARGVGYADPVYYDAEAARAAGYAQLPAPPAYLGTPMFVPGGSDAVFSGPPGTGPRPRYGLEHVLEGGTEVRYERAITAGETLLATDRLLDLQVKESRSLGTMLIVSTEATFRDENGELVARERSQYIFY